VEKSRGVCERSAQILSERCRGYLGTERRVVSCLALCVEGKLASCRGVFRNCLAPRFRAGKYFCFHRFALAHEFDLAAADDPDYARTEVIAALKAGHTRLSFAHTARCMRWPRIEFTRATPKLPGEHVKDNGSAAQIPAAAPANSQIEPRICRHAPRWLLPLRVTEEARTPVRIAEKLARRIAREKMPWLIRLRAGAGCHCQYAFGTRKGTALCLQQRRVCRRRYGFDAVVTEGVWARCGWRARPRLIAETDEWMAKEGIKNPPRMTRMLAPGWDD